LRGLSEPIADGEFDVVLRDVAIAGLFSL